MGEQALPDTRDRLFRLARRMEAAERVIEGEQVGVKDGTAA